MIKRIILLVIICSANLWLSAQDNSPTQQYLQEAIDERPFDQASWNTAKEGIDFKDEVRVDRYDEDFSDEDEANQGTRRVENGGGSSTLGILFKILMVIGAVILIAFLLNQFIGGGGINLRRNRTVDSSPLEVSLEKIEEELMENDVDRLHRLAIQEANYPLALRLKYLAIIKSLYLNGYTRWKKDKTNRQYIREIEDTESRKIFRKLTLTYERVWYGQGQINLQDYQQIEPEFLAFTKKIEANPQKIVEIVNG